MRPAATRRDFLKLGAMAGLALALPADALAKAAGAARGERHLTFFNTHTGERLTTMYCCDGEYVPRALQKINHILRDHRANEIKPIDPQLLDLLHGLSDHLDTNEPYHVISGYRSPNTNAMLRTRGGTTTGVATRSLHMVGKAIDIRVPGVKLAKLRETARTLKRGGVGYYPASNFVHVDTGRVRYW